jgi:hypothetical protein
MAKKRTRKQAAVEEAPDSDDEGPEEVTQSQAREEAQKEEERMARIQAEMR